MYLGGNTNQTRLAELYEERVTLRGLEAFLEPLFYFFKQSRQRSEGFGDFCARVGFDALRDYAKHYVPSDRVDSLPTVSIDEDTYKQLEALAQSQGKSLAHVATETLQRRV